ncbi:hypothetical protein D3C75_1287380 [compost metagenome]
MPGICDSQLFDDVGHMKLDRTRSDPQDHPRLLIGFAHAGPVEDFVFPFGKLGALFRARGVFFRQRIQG